MCVITLTTSITLIFILMLIIYVMTQSKKKLAGELEERIHERTKELQKSVDSLQRFRTERNVLLDGISKRINASLATIKGLGQIASTYENIPVELVRNIDVAADTLSDILQQIASEKKL